MMETLRRVVSCFLVICFASAAGATQNFLQSDLSKTTAAAQFFDELDTTITVTSNAESWFALVNLAVNNTSTVATTKITITLRESLAAVPDETLQPSIPPGLWTVQLPHQFLGSQLGVGPHTFRVRVSQDTNNQMVYQTESYLGLFNNTGFSGSITGAVAGPGSSTDRTVPIWDGSSGTMLADSTHWFIDSAQTLSTTDGHIGIQTTTPAALIDASSVTAEEVMKLSASGSGAGPFIEMLGGSNGATHTLLNVTDNSNSGSAGRFKFVQQISDGGASWNGFGSVVIGLGVDITGAPAGSNYGFFAQNGDIVALNGRVGVGTFQPTAFIDSNSTSPTVPAARLTNSGLSNSAALNITATGTGASAARGGEITTTNNNASGSADGLRIAATNNNGTARAIDATVNAKTGNGMTFQVNGSSAGTGSTGVAINVDGGGHTGSDVGLKIDVSNTTDAEAIRTNGGGTFLGAVGFEGFSYNDTTKHVSINGGTANTDKALTVTSDTNKTAVQEVCAGTTGQTCMTTTLNGGAAGTNIGHQVVVSGSGTSDNIGLYLSAGGGSGASLALTTVFGDTALGTFGVAEGLHYNDTTKQTILGASSGVATNVAGSTLEVHNPAAGKIGMQVIAVGEGSTAITSGLDNAAVTTASAAHIFTNAQTSSTPSVNKTAASFSSTGTWNGASAVNAAVVAAASGGSANYDVWAQLAGIRNDGAHVDTPVTTTCADTGNGSNQTKTITVTTQSYIIINQLDTDGCDITMAESVPAGTLVDIECDTSGGPCNFADSAGVTELAGAYAAGNFDMISLRYNGSTWVERSRSNN